MPSEYWFTRVLLWTILVYVMLAAVVVLARLRHDRRRLVFARIAALVENAGGTYPAQSGSLLWFDRASLRVLESGFVDMQASMPVMRACASYLVEQSGEALLV